MAGESWCGMTTSEMRAALEALADKMGERCGDHCPNSCRMCEVRNDLRLILTRFGAALATPSVASPQADPDPWIRPCPRIYSVQSSGSQVAYFNRESAERCIAERKEPEKFKLIEYVPADGTERTRENVRGYVAGFKAAEEYAPSVASPQ